MKKIRKHVAGIDIGAKKLFVSIENQPVKIFDTFIQDLELLASYLIRHSIETVAMEATGVYWVILYDILAFHNLDVCLVDGREYQTSTNKNRHPITLSTRANAFNFFFKFQE